RRRFLHGFSQGPNNIDDGGRFPSSQVGVWRPYLARASSNTIGSESFPFSVFRHDSEMWSLSLNVMVSSPMYIWSALVMLETLSQWKAMAPLSSPVARMCGWLPMAQ